MDVAKLAAEIEKRPHETIRAADGKAQLLVPTDALPPGVKASDIKITTLDPTKTSFTVDGRSPQRAYDLQPDGTRFTAPALFRAPASLGKDVTLLTSAVLLLEEQGATSVEVPLSHFSRVYISGFGFFASILSQSGGGTYRVGQSFTITATGEWVRDQFKPIRSALGCVPDWAGGSDSPAGAARPVELNPRQRI